MKERTVVFGIGALVLGDLIGAGILALPVSLGLSGMLPSVVLVVVYSSLMLFSAEVIARESAETRRNDFDFPSLYERYLGPVGKWIAVVTNAIVLYGLLVSYIAGGAQILADVLRIGIPAVWITIAFAALMIWMTTLDLSVINRYNAVLIAGLIVAFVGLIALSVGGVSGKALLVCEWKYAGIAIPLVVTAAHFHNIIPTLTADLKWNLPVFRKAMFSAMALAVLMNALWVLCGIGCLPRHGDNGLVTAFVNSVPATVPMHNVLGSPAFTVLSIVFSLVAIVTSFLANGVGLQNFVRDLLDNTFHRGGKWMVRLVTFLPPLVIAVAWPNIFIKALGVVGGVGIVTLFGILPCIIAVMRKGNSVVFRSAGAVFLALSVFALVVVVGGMCGNRLCAPDPTVECEEVHPGVTHEILDSHEDCPLEVKKPSFLRHLFGDFTI